MNRSYQPGVYIIMPAYNEEKHLKDVISQTLRYCRNIIVVDDGSNDSTLKIARSLPVTTLSLPINSGKGFALRLGIDYAFNKGAVCVITIDSDGQHPAKYIPRFIELLSNHDAVIGVRNIGRGSIPMVRKIGNKIASSLINLLYSIKVEDILCGFRGLTKHGYEYCRWQSTGYGVETEMIARIGKNKLKYAQVDIENIYLDQFKGVSLIDALEVFMSIPKFKLD